MSRATLINSLRRVIALADVAFREQKQGDPTDPLNDEDELAILRIDWLTNALEGREPIPNRTYRVRGKRRPVVIEPSDEDWEEKFGLTAATVESTADSVIFLCPTCRDTGMAQRQDRNGRMVSLGRPCPQCNPVQRDNTPVRFLDLASTGRRVTLRDELTGVEINELRGLASNSPDSEIRRAAAAMLLRYATNDVEAENAPQGVRSWPGHPRPVMRWRNNQLMNVAKRQNELAIERGLWVVGRPLSTSAYEICDSHARGRTSGLRSDERRLMRELRDGHDALNLNSAEQDEIDAQHALVDQEVRQAIREREAQEEDNQAASRAGRSPGSTVTRRRAEEMGTRARSVRVEDRTVSMDNTQQAVLATASGIMISGVRVFVGDALSASQRRQINIWMEGSPPAYNPDVLQMYLDNDPNQEEQASAAPEMRVTMPDRTTFAFRRGDGIPEHVRQRLINTIATPSRLSPAQIGERGASPDEITDFLTQDTNWRFVVQNARYAMGDCLLPEHAETARRFVADVTTRLEAYQRAYNTWSNREDRGRTPTFTGPHAPSFRRIMQRTMIERLLAAQPEHNPQHAYDAEGYPMACTGCQSRYNDQYYRDHPRNLSCCPERRMQRVAGSTPVAVAASYAGQISRDDDPQSNVFVFVRQDRLGNPIRLRIGSRMAQWQRAYLMSVARQDAGNYSALTRAKARYFLDEEPTIDPIDRQRNTVPGEVQWIDYVKIGNSSSPGGVQVIRPGDVLTPDQRTSLMTMCARLQNVRAGNRAQRIAFLRALLENSPPF